MHEINRLEGERTYWKNRCRALLLKVENKGKLTDSELLSMLQQRLTQRGEGRG